MTATEETMSTPGPTGSRARRAWFLGTPFCGSTVFGQALGVHPGVTYLGEADRLVAFPASVWAEEPVATCHYCELHEQPCPVWTPARVDKARGLPYGELMSYFESELQTPVLVDGSKHAHWLRAVLADRPGDLDAAVAFVTVRSPFAFVDSYRFRTGCPTWQAANVWRDVYYDALRLATRKGMPLMVVRYEEFALDPEPVLRRASTLLASTTSRRCGTSRSSRATTSEATTTSSPCSARSPRSSLPRTSATGCPTSGSGPPGSPTSTGASPSVAGWTAKIGRAHV